MTKHLEELRKYIPLWENLSIEQKRQEVPKIVALLSDQDGIKSPNIEILIVGPPNVRGFYDISKDTLYINSYLLNHKSFKPVHRSLVHLMQYKRQISDILKYMAIAEKDPSIETDPKYDQLRAIKENLNKYIYPWGDKNVIPRDEEPKELFWISANNELDWEELKSSFK